MFIKEKKRLMYSSIKELSVNEHHSYMDFMALLLNGCLKVLSLTNILDTNSHIGTLICLYVWF